jgi:hypothetical protein
MKNALIGFSGFVGSTLLKEAKFTSLYRSTNINEIDGQSFDTVVCAGASAQKWIANQEPNIDRQKIMNLIAHLKTIKCQNFILISTIDIFKNAIAVYENTAVDETDLHPYGLNRYLLEKFVQDNFSKFLIVRLPGLVGPGLRKNIIFDFLNNNNLSAIDSRGIFQFYPMVNLWKDIQTACKADLNLIHLTAEPVSVGDIAKYCFNKTFENILANKPAKYDMRTLYAKIFSRENNYIYNVRETIEAIKTYAESEPLTNINKK